MTEDWLDWVTIMAANTAARNLPPGVVPSTVWLDAEVKHDVLLLTLTYRQAFVSALPMEFRISKPKRCTCQCHRPGLKVKHVVACCDRSYEPIP